MLICYVGLSTYMTSNMKACFEQTSKPPQLPPNPEPFMYIPGWERGFPIPFLIAVSSTCGVTSVYDLLLMSRASLLRVYTEYGASSV